MQNFFGRLVCCTEIDPADWVDGSSDGTRLVLVVVPHRMQTVAAVAIDTDLNCRIHCWSHDSVLDYTAAFVDIMFAVDSMHAMWDLGKSVNYSMADLIVAADLDCRIFDLDRLQAAGRGHHRMLDCSYRHTLVGNSRD